MKYYRKQSILPFVTIIVSLILPGCAEDKVVDRFAAAKECLSVGDYRCAEDELEGKSGDEAAMLSAMVEFGQWTAMVGDALVEIAQYVADTTNDEKAPVFAALADVEQPASARLINRTLNSILQPGLDQLDRTIAAFDKVRGSTLEMTIESMPLYAGNIPLVEFSGTFSANDLLLIEGWLHGLGWLYTSLLATDFGVHLGPLIRYGLSLDTCKFGVDLAQARECAARLSAFAIGNAKNVLQIEPDNGPERRRKSREHLALFFELSNEFITQLAATPAADQRWASWSPEPSGGGWVVLNIGDIPLTVGDVEERFASNAQRSAVDSVAREVRYRVPGGVLDGTKDAVSNVRTGSPAFVPIQTTILPALTTGVEVLLQIDGLIRLLQIVVSGADPALASAIADVATDFQELYSGFDSKDGLANLFEYALPESLDFSFAAAYDDPRHLRALAPDLVTVAVFDDRVTEGLFTYEWLVEWECPTSAIENFVCTVGSKLTDSDHFLASPITLPADKIASPLPYLGYSDPTFNGAVQFDPWEVDRTQARGKRAPTLNEFNIMMQEALFDIGLRLGLSF